MNENIDLTKILKDCPKGFKLYTPLIGEVEFIKVRKGILSVLTLHSSGVYLAFTKEGFFNFSNTDAECLLFPSYEHCDWSKFSTPWHKKEKFDPKTLKPFDRVLVRDTIKHQWKVDFFSHYITEDGYFPYRCTSSAYRLCIPYNDDTKHLVGTKEEAPEYYRYWED